MLSYDPLLNAGRRLQQAWQTSALGLFLRECITRPTTVGAVWPSSQPLAEHMASRVPIAGDGLVVELGAGTGAVTRALLARGIPPRRLVVIERSPAFARHLRARFPRVNVVLGDAAHLESLLPPGARVDAIVSSLPLRSLPSIDVAAITAQWRHLLSADGVVVQFTYDLRQRLRQGMHGFAVSAGKIVWVNLPPACIVVLTRGHAIATD